MHKVLAAVAALMMFAAPVSAKQPPNIIFVYSDDETTEGMAAKYMPKVNALLAQQGITFTRYYHTFPMCCPSRSSFLTGMYPHNTGVLDNGGVNGGYKKFMNNHLDRSTIAVWLKGLGYRTALLGKYLNGYPIDTSKSVPQGWSDWLADSGKGNQGFDYDINRNGTVEHHGTGVGDYFTTVIAAEALRLIKDQPKDGRPLFLYVTPHAPHAPSVPDYKYQETFRHESLPVWPSMNEADVSDKPAHIRNLPLLTDAHIHRITKQYRDKLASALSIDDMVGDIVQALTATGEIDNTYILFTTDNGFEQGQHRVPYGKDKPYEEATRSHLFARGPGIPMGIVDDDHLVGTHDLAPTFITLAGGNPPSNVDGRSLVPLFTQPVTAPWRYALETMGAPVSVLEAPDEIADVSANTSPPFETMVTRHWKFTRYPTTGEFELYDLVADPYEMDNLAHKMPKLIQETNGFFDSLATCDALTCFVAENRALPKFERRKP